MMGGEVNGRRERGVGKVRRGQCGSSQPGNGVPATKFNWRW